MEMHAIVILSFLVPDGLAFQILYSIKSYDIRVTRHEIHEMIRGNDLITGISVTLVRPGDEVIPCHFPSSFKPDIEAEVSTRILCGINSVKISQVPC